MLTFPDHPYSIGNLKIFGRVEEKKERKRMEKVVSVNSLLRNFSSGFECVWKVALVSGKRYTVKGTLSCEREVYAFLRQHGIQPKDVARIDTL
jgi:hypothetical protein